MSALIPTMRKWSVAYLRDAASTHMPLSEAGAPGGLVGVLSEDPDSGS